jgi:hypothetical protein
MEAPKSRGSGICSPIKLSGEGVRSRPFGKCSSPILHTAGSYFQSYDRTRTDEDIARTASNHLRWNLLVPETLQVKVEQKR